MIAQHLRFFKEYLVWPVNYIFIPISCEVQVPGKAFQFKLFCSLKSTKVLYDRLFQANR